MSIVKYPLPKMSPLSVTVKNPAFAMAGSEFISELRSKLSTEACVITDASKKEFQLALLRWSDVDVKIPGAIVQVSNELDAALTVISTV